MHKINPHKFKWKAGLLLGLLIVLMTGCGTPQMEYDTAEEAKQAFVRAQTIEIYVDLYTPHSKTEILADGKVAAVLKGKTVYVDGEEWFHYDYVTDEPINEDREGVITATTYGYYDKEGSCLGYTQKQCREMPGGYDYYMMFLDTEWNPLPYYSSVDGETLYDENGSVVGTGYAGKEGVSLFRKLYTNVYRTVLETDRDAGVELDFMYRMAMMEGLQDDIRLVYDEPVNTVLEIIESILGVPLLLFAVLGTLIEIWDKMSDKGKQRKQKAAEMEAMETEETTGEE